MGTGSWGQVVPGVWRLRGSVHSRKEARIWGIRKEQGVCGGHPMVEMTCGPWVRLPGSNADSLLVTHLILACGSLLLTCFSLDFWLFIPHLPQSFIWNPPKVGTKLWPLAPPSFSGLYLGTVCLNIHDTGFLPLPWAGTSCICILHCTHSHAKPPHLPPEKWGYDGALQKVLGTHQVSKQNI